MKEYKKVEQEEKGGILQWQLSIHDPPSSL